MKKKIVEQRVGQAVDSGKAKAEELEQSGESKVRCLWMVAMLWLRLIHSTSSCLPSAYVCLCLLMSAYGCSHRGCTGINLSLSELRLKATYGYLSLVTTVLAP